METVNLFYTKTGQGRPLIMLHGNGETHEIFHRAIPLLAETYTVYAIDSRGHGKSGMIGTELHYEDMMADIHNFILEHQLEKPMIYGFSDGGIVALLLAIKYPDLLSAIIVSGVNANPDGLVPIWLKIFKFIYGITKSYKYKMMITEPNISDEMLGQITIPVIMTGGSKDMIQEKHLKHLESVIPQAKLTIFEHENHGSYIINSDKIAKHILSEIPDYYW